jgi:hypothetical protein
VLDPITSICESGATANHRRETMTMCNINSQIGPFMQSAAVQPIARVVEGVNFLVGIATFGLIGTEHNGIFVLDDTNMCVVMDRHCEGSAGGFGPYANQITERERILALSDVEFIQFIRRNPRFRGVGLPLGVQLTEG